MTTTLETKAAAVKVTRCKDWPNALGFDCTVNGNRFSVVSDREIGRLVAVRMTNEGVTHSCRICEGRESNWIDGNRNVAALVYRMWRDRRDLWIRHED